MEECKNCPVTDLLTCESCGNPDVSESAELACSTAKWIIGEVHPQYGEVQMMGRISGEAYRWFSKNNVVSMIPLSILQGQ